ncbi:related to transporter (major facilitator superfamily) [Lecanosticta acicola]|uniref:Related to transporter (Major facilitator superfamily) n=1 Tax=Lecanosticta acicola TaxID=111012 RepID=A0AAI9EFN3_9PEZI|nr:related to transporter (major facilitator superfamily) [Lecanosticta acicola]
MAPSITHTELEDGKPRQSGPSMDVSSFGWDYMRSAPPSRRPSFGTTISDEYENIASGAATPTPLLGKPALSRNHTYNGESLDRVYELQDLHQTHSHMGDALQNLALAITDTSHAEEGQNQLERTLSRRLTPAFPDGRRPSHLPSRYEEEGSPTGPRKSQGVPPELRNLTAEIVFVTVCSAGQLLFAFFMGDVNVNQQAFKTILGLEQGQLPWLVGSFLTALGLSVILSGSLTDLLPPKLLIVGAFVWLTIWNIIGVFSLTPSRSILFFIMRAMQGLAVGILVSGSMSILGRVYNPGQRKTRVFSAMAAGAPFGFWLGALQGGALSSRLDWIFGSNAIICGLCALAAYVVIPSLRPVADNAGAEAPTLRSFDWKGAICATAGCICLLFGLTQGSVAEWSPYTYSLIIAGVLILIFFFWLETKVRRPLVPARLWKTPGFAPLMLAYFLGFGGFVGAWQFYAVQFFLTQQKVSSMTVALYLLPNAIMGVLATFIVSRLMHRIPGHYIFLASQFFFALGPAFFLPQKPSTSYFALSMPGIGLATFGPDLSFAAASIYITSSVARSHQGSAGSLLVTIQNLSSAIMTSVADSIAAKVDGNAQGEVGLEGLRAAWWLALGAAVVGGVVTAVWVRIPKEEEKDHVA